MISVSEGLIVKLSSITAVRKNSHKKTIDRGCFRKDEYETVYKMHTECGKDGYASFFKSEKDRDATFDRMKKALVKFGGDS